MLAGLVWTVAITALWLGRITVVGVGFAAALLGMGVEYGIHGGARFRQLRLAGQDAADGPGRHLPRSGAGDRLLGADHGGGPGGAVPRPLPAAARAGAGAHGGGAGDPGDHGRDSGRRALVAFPRRSDVLDNARAGCSAPVRPAGALRARPASRPAGRRSVLGMAALLTAVSVWGVSRLSLSTDLRSLRPADHPSAEAERLLVEHVRRGARHLHRGGSGPDAGRGARRGGRGPAGPRSRGSAPTAADHLAGGLARSRAERLERRLAELRALPLERAADDFERELVAAGFRLEPFAPALAAMRALGRGEDPGAPPPRGVAALDVRAGARARPPRASRWRSTCGCRWAARTEGAEELARQLHQVSPGLALASIPRVGAELRELALGRPRPFERRGAGPGGPGGARLHALADRRLAALRPAARPRAACGRFGLWGAFGGRVDLLAISTLPVLFGTGIDLGVHAVHGGRMRPDEGIRGTVERFRTGDDPDRADDRRRLRQPRARRACRASRTPALLVAVGVTACLLATFLVLPALESLFRAEGAEGIRP